GGPMARLCARLQPDVVQTHGYRPDVLDAGAARRLGIPVVTTVHGYTGGSWRNRLYERLQRRAFRRFDAVVAVSQRLADSLTHDGVPRDRVHLIRNAWAGAEPLLDRDAARRAPGEGRGGNGARHSGGRGARRRLANRGLAGGAGGPERARGRRRRSAAGPRRGRRAGTRSQREARARFRGRALAAALRGGLPRGPAAPPRW